MGKDQELLEAARNGNVVVVEKLLSSKAKRGGPLASLRRGPGANVQDASGYSSLHHAALNGHREIVALLLEHEASPNITDSKGSSPLHLAAWAGHADIVRVLLTAGVRVTQINLKNKDNETALHCGAQYGHSAVVNLLLTYGADPSIRNVKDETALDLAALYGRLETVEILLKKHPELIEPYKSGLAEGVSTFRITPLHAASRNGHRSVVDVLLKAGFPVSLSTRTGSALHEASLCGKVDVVRRLLEAGIDVSLKDANGRTALRIVQDLPTPVAQEIASLIQNSALLVNLPPASTSVVSGSPYENVSFNQRYSKGGQAEFKGSSSMAPDSYITLPRRRQPRVSTSSSSQSQKSDGSVYEVPPPPRSLPWVQRSNGEEDALEHSSSQSELQMSDDSTGNRKASFATSERLMSCSYDERSMDSSMSISMMSCPPCTSHDDHTTLDKNCNAFSRSSRSRHSADQYLPMSIPSQSKVSPNPPAKPPRRTQIAPNFDSLPRPSTTRGGAGHRSTQSTVGLSGSSSGYELVYFARTGSRDETERLKGRSPPKFRIQSGYVDMAPGSTPARNAAYQNVQMFRSVDESNYDIPRELGGSKAYENVTLALDAATDPATNRSAATPPTPDHPPPPAHLAEQRIHERIRPLSEELKRQSRDIETETEEELFLTASTNGFCFSEETATPASSGSLSLSPSDKSISTDNIEEVTGDEPFAGLMRGSVPVTRSMERPQSLRGHTNGGTNGSGTRIAPGDSHSIASSGSANGPRRTLSTSLSVLSPFDEQEEWTKIWEILGSFSSGFDKESPHLIDEVQREFQNRIDSLSQPTTGPKMDDVIDVPTGGSQDTVSDWLLSMGLQQYLSVLVGNGFDDVDFLGDGILDDASLRELGIGNDEHRTVLCRAAASLTTPLQKMSTCPPSSVEEWLHLLRLPHYVDHFKKNCFDEMERVRRVWEVELTTVIEIRLLGHLRRILVSLGNQRINGPSISQAADHPSVAKCTETAENLSELTSDLQKISTSIARLEDEISQKMIENSVDVHWKATGTLSRRKSRPAPRPPASKPETLLKNAVEDLSIRDPSQLVDGIAKSVATHWRHQAKDLIQPGVFYQAQYLGSTLVRNLRGTESTKRSIQKLKKKYAEPASCNPSTCMILAISLSGVHFVEASSQETICKHEIRNIHCACQDADDLTHFAYITKDHATQDHYCHVFRVPTMDLATEIILTLGQAFEVAYQLFLRDQDHQRSQPCDAQCQLPVSQVRTSVVEPPAPVPAVPATPAAPVVKATGERPAIAAKPTNLPPKPKLGLVENGGVNSHSRSYSTDVPNLHPPESFSAKVMKKSASTNSTGRAPLAAGEEL